ncbi:hypothetical protein [Spiroplasma poulsonii]|uniref:hypothetical protein n=1 Tax=Spiroplasma poulsonii TaxID=2138 RepID=UPI001F4C813C|nr:hypothetical protein [Spiroplasma poulsonii]UNF61590.1 hypothetical protein MNU24_06675 [Spiroplasma poulsonii]
MVDNDLRTKHSVSSILKNFDAKERFFKQHCELLTFVSNENYWNLLVGKFLNEEAQKIKNVKWLGQGTIYPDVIESVSVKGPSATIKSQSRIPLRDFNELNHYELFQRQFRKIGVALGNLRPSTRFYS